MDNMLPQISRLFCHPASPAAGIRGASASISLANDGFMLMRYWFDCAYDALDIGIPAAPLRTDDLWKNTCFEAFLQIDAEPGDEPSCYVELNFAPSGQWAAYHFTAYREGMTALEIDQPCIAYKAGGEHFEVEASLQLPDIWRGKPLRAGISAVIAEKDGTKSYWALIHTGTAPDFHDQACFTLQLLPAETI